MISLKEDILHKRYSHLLKGKDSERMYGVSKSCSEKCACKRVLPIINLQLCQSNLFPNARGIILTESLINSK